MSKINDGGPAFPFEYELGEGLGRTNHTGMSLRDWFAGQAISQVIASCRNDNRKEGESIERMFARKAYDIADALLQSREATHG